MKSIKHTILTAALNAGESSVTIEITDERGNKKIPASIIFDNVTTADLGILYIDSDAELALRGTNPEYFDFIPLETGRSGGDLPSSVKYVIVTVLSGTATANLDLWTLGAFS